MKPFHCVLLASSVVLACAVVTLSASNAEERLSREQFRELHSQLREKMDEDLNSARLFLEEKITASPESSDLQILREILAERMADERNFKDATTQMQSLLKFQVDHIDDREHQYGIALTIKSLKRIVDLNDRFYASGKNDNRDLVDQAFDALKTMSEGKDFKAELPLAQLSVEKAIFLVRNKEEDVANELVQSQLKRLEGKNESDQATEESAKALLQMLRRLTSEDSSNDAWRDDCIAKLKLTAESAIAKYPKSLAIQNDYADVQYLTITRWEQDDPEANEKRIDETRKNLAKFAMSNRSVTAVLRRIDLYRDRIKQAKPVETLVGKPAPKWDIDSWVNSDEATQDSFKGKVVLVDFWAMWCGPCIATFPHLREWREEFEGDDFEIVGVTQYYNMEWDEKRNRATRSDADVSAWNERTAIQSFLDHYKLKHPVFVTPEGSEMQGKYGVRGIPLVVLLDRDGVVQLVKTGAGKATADEIHAKIKELVKAK